MIKSFFQFCVETIIDVKPTYVTYSKPTKVKPLATVPPKQPPVASTSTSNKSSNLPVPVLNTINVKSQKALPGPNRSLVKPSEKPPIKGETIKNKNTLALEPPKPPKANTQRPDQPPLSKDQSDNEPEDKMSSKQRTSFKLF